MNDVMIIILLSVLLYISSFIATYLICDAFEEKIKQEGALMIFLVVLSFVPMIGFITAYAILRLKERNECVVCYVEKYSRKQLCKKCDKLYTVNDKEDLRLARFKHGIKLNVKKKVIDEEIERLRVNEDVDVLANEIL